MRFQELRDADGTVIAKGLHPAIAIVAAGAVARAAAISAVVSTKGCKILHPSDIEDELKRAGIAAVEQHQAAVEHHKAIVAEAQKALQQAVDAGLKTSRDVSVVASDLARFDDLAGRLAAAEAAYEAAVRTDAEAARTVAAALGELDRILAQRQSASSSLDQARKAADNRGVPDAVVQQAMNLQGALAKAESEKRDAVEHADVVSQAARGASREALTALDAAHTALRSGMSLMSSGSPEWGPGIPLPGLVANFRDYLAAAVAQAQAAENNAKSVEASLRSRLDENTRDLEQLVSTGPQLNDPQGTVALWLGGDSFSRDDAVFADEAFARFGAQGTAALVSALASKGCQVIYLTEDPELLGWAIGLPSEAGGASTISATRARKPALVND